MLGVMHLCAANLGAASWVCLMVWLVGVFTLVFFTPRTSI